MKPSRSPVRAVFFDLGNVLVLYDAERALKRFTAGSGCGYRRVRKFFFKGKPVRDYGCGKISSREFYARCKRALKLKTSYADFSRFWNDIFWENDGMDALLSRLKRRYCLVLISNTNRLHFDYIRRRFRLLRHFHRMFPSHEVGCLKPGVKIFRHVLKKTGFAAGEVVFIDDMPSFVRGARKAGIRAIRFRGRLQLERSLSRWGVR